MPKDGARGLPEGTTWSIILFVHLYVAWDKCA